MRPAPGRAAAVHACLRQLEYTDARREVGGHSRIREANSWTALPPLRGKQETRLLDEAGSQETMWHRSQLAEASGSDGKLHLVGLLYHL